MIEMHVGILSNIPENVSSNGAEKDLDESRSMVCKSLRSLGYEILILNVTKRNLSYFKRKLLKSKVDIIFNLCDRIDDDMNFEPNVLSILDSLKIPYTGADVENVKTCDNKVKVKEILIKNNILTPNYQSFDSNDDEMKNVNFPAIVKPSQTHNSLGISEDSVVNSEDKLKEKINYVVKNFNQPALVEEFIKGRDIEVTILGNDNLEVLPIAELYYEKLGRNPDKIFSYESKWDQGQDSWGNYIIPDDIPEDVKEKIIVTSKKIFKLFKLKDFGRIDMRLSTENEPYVLEVTVNPCLSSIGSTIKAAEAIGLTYNELINKILLNSFKRNGIKTGILEIQRISEPQNP